MHYRWVAAATLLLTASCAAHAQPTLEQRVERMEAESDIRRMLIEYGKFLDAKDFASYAALFAEDGVWTGVVPVRTTYADVASGECVALAGSRGLLEIAVRDGSAAEVLGVGFGAEVAVDPPDLAPDT